MKEPVVVDTSILLSALITDSKTRSLVVNLDHQLVAPEPIYNEIEDYRDLIREKSGLNREELDSLLKTLFKYIQVIPTEDLKEHLEKADKELGEIDKDDVIFLAAALSINGSIWSDDKHLQQQNQIPVYTTTQIIKQTDQ